MILIFDFVPFFGFGPTLENFSNRNQSYMTPKIARKLLLIDSRKVFKSLNRSINRLSKNLFRPRGLIWTPPPPKPNRVNPIRLLGVEIAHSV